MGIKGLPGGQKAIAAGLQGCDPTQRPQPRPRPPSALPCFPPFSSRRGGVRVVPQGAANLDERTVRMS